MSMGFRPEDRPNMTSMIDVVFLLLIFFLVTMKFKTLDMKIDADLPTRRGMALIPVDQPEPPKLVAKLRPTGTTAARVLLSNREIGTTDDPQVWSRFAALAESALERHADAGGFRVDFEAEIDADAGVRAGAAGNLQLVGTLRSHCTLWCAW